MTFWRFTNQIIIIIIIIGQNDILPVSQSAYRQFHSTETAVLKVYNDLLLAADSGQVSAL